MIKMKISYGFLHQNVWLIFIYLVIYFSPLNDSFFNQTWPILNGTQNYKDFDVSMLFT